MAIVSPRTRLVYFPVPKVACTTAKRAFWQIEHAGPSARARLALARTGARLGLAPRLPGIHHRPGYETQPFAPGFSAPAGFETVALIRDPLLRLRSAWANKADRAALRRWNEEEAAAAEGLPADPDFRTFIHNLDRYRAVSRAVREHTRPHGYYLGPSLAALDHVFALERIGEFFELLRQRSGQAIDNKRENISDADFRDATVTLADADALRAATAADYAYLAPHYSFEKGLARLLAG